MKDGARLVYSLYGVERESGCVIEMGGKVVRNVMTYGRRTGHT